jgi:Phytanoyl-CoA dioxygenase (PhyH)
MTTFTPPRFEIDDEKALEYLNNNGYVVFGNVLNNTEIQSAIDLFWDWIESLGKGIKRNDVRTWNSTVAKNQNKPGDKGWFGYESTGIISEYHIGQSEFLWLIRSIPKVRQAFEFVWKQHNKNTSNMLVSFDGCNAIRPCSVNPDWAVRFSNEFPRQNGEGWLHTDLNLLTDPNMLCYQGFVNLLDCDETKPGFVVCPESNKYLKRYTEEMGDKLIARLNTTKLTEVKDYINHPIKLNYRAGDLVIFTSHTFHANSSVISNNLVNANSSVITGTNCSCKSVCVCRIPEPVNLDRLIAYVCMMPLDMVPEEKREQLIKERLEAVEKGITTSHWPNWFYPKNTEFTTSSYKPIQLSEYQVNLVTGQ